MFIHLVRYSSKINAVPFSPAIMPLCPAASNAVVLRTLVVGVSVISTAAFGLSSPETPVKNITDGSRNRAAANMTTILFFILAPPL